MYKLELKTEQEFEAAVLMVSLLMDADGKPELTALEVLAIAVEKYEDIHYPIGAPAED